MKASAPSRRVDVPAASRLPLLGHVAIAPIDSLVEKTREQLVPAAFQSLVDIETLRRTLVRKSKSPQGEAVAEHLDMTRPVLCAVADPLVLDTPFGCAFGYEGGAAQLAIDGYPKTAARPADGHTAHVFSDDKDVYLDDRDGFVVLAQDPNFIAKAGEPLVRLANAPSGRDFEIVVYPWALHEIYMPLVREELEQLAAGTHTGSQLRAKLEELAWKEIKQGLSDADISVDDDDESSVQEALAKLDAMTPQDAKKILDEFEVVAPYFEQTEAVGLGFELEPEGLVLSAWYDTMPGASLHEQWLAGPKLDRAWLALLPDTSVLAGASIDTKDDVELLAPLLDDEDYTDLLIEGLGEFYQEQTGNSPASIEADLREFLTSRNDLYGPRSAWSIYTDAAGPGAMVVILDNQDGKSGRDDWRRWSSRFSADRILGHEAAQYITWEHQADAFESHGTPVDRWTLRLTDEAVKEIRDESSSSTSTWEENLLKYGADGLHVDRVESDGNTSFVFAPAGSKAFVGVALAAQGSRSRADGLDTILGRGPHPVSLWGFDIHAAMEQVNEFASDEVPSKLRDAELGRDLSDIYGVTYLREDGGTAELVISQHLIDQIKVAATK